VSEFCNGVAVPIKTISILGSGWLGLPLARRFAARGDFIKTSTTSSERLVQLTREPVESHVIDLRKPLDGIEAFLQASTLVINITCKDIDGFRRLLQKVEASDIANVLFVSSTSVYPAANKTVTETAGEESPGHPLVEIENLFRQSTQFSTTIVRFSGLIGGRRHPGRFFRGGKIVKDPDARVNLIHLDDCLNILVRIVDGNVWGEVFNASADSHPKKREFYTHAAALADMPAPKFEESHAAAFKIVDNRKLKQMLDYEFVYPDLMAISFDGTQK